MSMILRMNPLAFDFGFIQIHWYSIILFIAFFIGGTLALSEARKWKIPEDFMINSFFFMIPIALIGARLYFVLFHLDSYREDPISIFKVWEGGLAIHGGIIAGFLWLLIYAKKYKISVLRLLDIIVISLIIGQVIGRWGNFFNGEAYGPLTTLDFLQSLHLPNFIIEGMHIDGLYYQPTFLYESIWNLFGFIALLIIRKRKRLHIGSLTSIYLVWYGIGRFWIEGLRQDSLMLGSLKMAQIASLVMIVIGIILFIMSIRKDNNYYHDRENVNEIKF